jgi:DNA-binding XRE family transcriptional regulator
MEDWMKMHEARDKKEEFLILRAYEGKSFDQISSEIDVSKNTLLKWERENNALLGAMNKIRTNQVIESTKIKLEHRLERLGVIQESLFQEILKIDFSAIPQHKIIELFLSVQKSIKDECLALKLESNEGSIYLGESF